MSQSFSRRTFLKYSAAAAVAVAGTSLLGGCSSGEDHTQTGTNTSNSVLKIKSTLKSAAYDAEKKTLTFEFEVNNGRISSVLVNRNSFYVEATNNYQALADSKILVLSTAEKIPDGVVAHGKTGTFMITASGVPALNDTDVVTLRFFPDPTEYAEYSASWKLVVKDHITITNAGAGEES